MRNGLLFINLAMGGRLSPGGALRPLHFGCPSWCSCPHPCCSHKHHYLSHNWVLWQDISMGSYLFALLGQPLPACILYPCRQGVPVRWWHRLLGIHHWPVSSLHLTVKQGHVRLRNLWKWRSWWSRKGWIKWQSDDSTSNKEQKSIIKTTMKRRWEEVTPISTRIIHFIS